MVRSLKLKLYWFVVLAVLLATSTPFALAQEEESSNDAAAEAEQQAAAAAAAEAAAAEAAARVGEYGSMKHFVSQSVIHTYEICFTDDASAMFATF